MGDVYQEVEFVADAVGERLDKALAARFGELSRTQLQSLIREGQVLVDGQPAKPAYRIEGGEKVLVKIPLPVQEEGPKPEAITLDVVYEDDDLAAINKPAGMVVHPAFGHTSGTLVNAVLARWPQIAAFGEAGRAGVVHRLDKETSGVILVAKTAAALDDLREQFRSRAVRKHYLALVEGVPNTPAGIIEAPVGRDPKQRKRMGVAREGREAITEFHVLETYAHHALLEVLPRTGRTHQIRVHLAFVGCPVVGDTVYGRRKPSLKLKRHFLHADSITFEQPSTREWITVEAPLPPGLQDILRKLPR